jgi:serine/threonine-protein kinase HipA
VQQIADAIVVHRVAVTRGVADQQGCTRGYVEQAASLIEENALRIAGRLKTST